MKDPVQIFNNEQKTDRRGFLKLLLGFSGLVTAVGVLTPVIGYLWPPKQASTVGAGRVPVGSTEEFPVGQGKVVPVDGKPVIIVNTDQGGLTAYSAVCTHLGCVVEWDDRRQFILCPCHDGRFNAINGAVISGPPPTPLPELPLVVEQDTVYVSPA
ncbi:MAG: Rieske (2Fe-2S) protein [Caldilineales bacterium]|nr:Rieske (2Fe-2S) protein [Caldilineales bacterium]